MGPRKLQKPARPGVDFLMSVQINSTICCVLTNYMEMCKTIQIDVDSFLHKEEFQNK